MHQNSYLIQKEEYLEDELNTLMKGYKENEINKDIFYEEQKREKQKAAMEENIRLKKQQQEEKDRELENQKVLDEVSISNEDTVEETLVNEEVNSVSIKTTPKEEQKKLSSENNVDEDLKKSLEAVDPWLERKMEQQENN